MTKKNIHPLWRLCVVVAAVASTAAMPPISEQARATLDRTLGTTGVYVAEESAHTFVFPRTDISVRIGRQRLSSAQAPRSWATFSPSMHQEGAVSGEIIVREDEVNRVMSAALGTGLEVTGLGAMLFFEQPRVLAMNLWGEGTFSIWPSPCEGRSTRSDAREVRDRVRRSKERPCRRLPIASIPLR